MPCHEKIRNEYAVPKKKKHGNQKSKNADPQLRAPCPNTKDKPLANIARR